MTTRRKLKRMIADEHKAVREYGHEARTSTRSRAKVFRHIQGEEREHAVRLTRMKRGLRRGSR